MQSVKGLTVQGLPRLAVKGHDIELGIGFLIGGIEGIEMVPISDRGEMLGVDDADQMLSAPGGVLLNDDVINLIGKRERLLKGTVFQQPPLGVTLADSRMTVEGIPLMSSRNSTW